MTGNEKEQNKSNSGFWILVRLMEQQNRNLDNILVALVEIKTMLESETLIKATIFDPSKTNAEELRAMADACEGTLKAPLSMPMIWGGLEDSGSRWYKPWTWFKKEADDDH